ncbi:hypothetical protein AM232_23510 [Bacillus sp. FJAT-21352]|nr:hypothetical protein AM232_23510 [Bacillus sp. FJAT-21352]
MSKGDPTGAKSAEEAPGLPAESECLEWKSTFQLYKPSKKLYVKSIIIELFYSLSPPIQLGCFYVIRFPDFEFIRAAFGNGLLQFHRANMEIS